MKSAPNILIVDSGVGGLSVAKEIFALHSHLHLTCIADNAAYPYGNKKDKQLAEHLIALIGKASTKLRPDVIVIACNTASTLALDHLRNTYDIPFIGVVPAIKPAAKLSKTGSIGVLATPATIMRPYTHELIQRHAENVEVQLHSSIELVHAAEQLTKGTPPKPHELLTEVMPLLQKAKKPIDTIVLACTHFPLLKKQLCDLNELAHILWIDSGLAIANRVSHWLETLSLPLEGQTNNSFSLFFTKPADNETSTQSTFRTYIQQNILNNESINIEINVDPFKD